MCSVFLDILFYEKEVSFPYFFFLKILLGMPPPHRSRVLNYDLSLS